MAKKITNFQVAFSKSYRICPPAYNLLDGLFKKMFVLKMFAHKQGIPQHVTFKNDSSCPWKFFNQGEGKSWDNTWIFPPVQSMPTFKDWAKSKILSPFRTLQDVS